MLETDVDPPLLVRMLFESVQKTNCLNYVKFEWCLSHSKVVAWENSPKFRDATTSSPTKSVWNFCAHFLDLILRGKGQWWHHEMLTDFSGPKIWLHDLPVYNAATHSCFLNFSYFFLSANEGISSYECFKYPWKFVGGSAWNTSLLRSAGIDPLQITFRVFVNIDSWCPSLQSFHSDVSSLFYMSVFTQRACFGRLWETCESMKTWV